MKIAVTPHHHQALQAKAAWHSERLRKWWGEQLAHARALGPSQARREALADLYADRAYRRGQGLWWDGQSAIIVYYLRQDLQARGWLDRRWPPVPHNQQHLPGRRWGVPHNPDRTWSARLQVRLPRDLDETLQRATYHVSRRPTERLQRWLRQHPYPHDPREQTELDRLRAEIITTGDVMRNVLAAATRDWFPYVGPPDDHGPNQIQPAG